ncbi:hypothetical protein ACH4VQ_08420 [Streptomyces anulatus]
MSSTVTARTLLARYAADIAFVAEEQPATTLDELAEQTSTAAERLEAARIQGAEDLDTASAALAAANISELPDQAAHLRHAARHLTDTTDMVDEYRLMV